MQSSSRCRVALFGAGLAAWIGAAMPLAAQQAEADSALVTPAWLVERLDEPSVRILDLGKTAAQFADGHIPNAQFVDWRTDIVDPADPDLFLVAPAAAIEALLSRLGVHAGTTIVLYDSQSSRLAARMFWVLRYYGHSEVRILDGGASAWAAAGGDLETATAPVAATTYRIQRTDSSLRADKAFMQTVLGRRGIAIVDARAPEFYTGEAMGSPFGSNEPNARAGRIPGAGNFFWADHFNPDGTFKSVEALRSAYAARGITAEQAVISYCHVGLQASTPWFVLSELLGFSDVRLYDASMAEWANSSDTELVIGGN